MSKKVVVIGGGFGGLAAAARLAARGHEVHLYDKRDQLGGRAYQYEINGFHFDGGPTVITAPHLFDDIFAAAGRRREDYFTLLPLDPLYRFFDQEGRCFNYWRGLDETAQEVARYNPDDAERYRAMLEHIRHIFDTFQPYSDKPLTTLGQMMTIMPDMVRLQAFMNTDWFIERYLKDPFLRKVFTFHPLLIGGNPLDTPAIYTLIMQFEKQWGVFYPQGGTGAIVRGFEKLLRELGVHIHLQREVAQIVIQNHKATGIRLDGGEEVKADAVVCNGDLPFVYKHLISAAHRRRFTDRKVDRMNYSMSLLVIYFGTKKRYLDSPLAHHNIIVNSRFRGWLKDIFRHATLPEDFSLYVHMPSRSDDSISPPGHENFYALVPVPDMRASIKWEQVGPLLRDKALAFLEEHYLPDLRANIVALHHIDPTHFRHTLNSQYGAAFSLRPTLLQSANFRPHCQSEEFDNLYFVGAGTHPGAGVPSVLSSGKIAADLIG